MKYEIIKIKISETCHMLNMTSFGDFYQLIVFVKSAQK